MLREIVLDTETTGLNFSQGDKIIEIGCMELLNKVPTGKFFHSYINPLSFVSKESYLIHGLNNDFLSCCPAFYSISNKFLDFIGNSKIIIHNAPFDLGFINMELKLINKNIIPYDRAIDTLIMARNIFPNKKNNLDILCKRFLISTRNRTAHSALIDSQLLAEVYYNLNFLKIIGYKSPTPNDKDEEEDEYVKNSSKFKNIYYALRGLINKNKLYFPISFLS